MLLGDGDVVLGEFLTREIAISLSKILAIGYHLDHDMVFLVVEDPFQASYMTDDSNEKSKGW